METLYFLLGITRGNDFDVLRNLFVDLFVCL